MVLASAVAAIALAAAASAALADWSAVAPTKLSTGGSWVLGVSAASVGGVPYVAWTEGAASGSVSGPVRVAALNGSTFSAVGGAVGSCDADPVIAAVGGAPYVACRGSGGVGVEVYTFSGTTWNQVGAAISTASTAYGPAIADVGGTPYVAFATQSGQVEVDSLSGGTWTLVGAQLLGMAGGIPETPALLSDGTTPILAWTESDTISASQQEDVFAAQLQSPSSWTPLNSGAQLNVSSSGAPEARLDGLAMIGSTPYLSLDEFATTGASHGYALALSGSGSGSGFQTVGGPVVTNTQGYFPQVALGTLAGTPLAVTADQDANGNVTLGASTFTSSAWGAIGYPLGVPPLPGSGLTPFSGAAVASDGTGTPYVFFLQQTNAGQGGGAQEGLFAEAYTAGGVNPNTPVDGNPNPPQITATTTPGTGTAPAALPAAFVELASTPRFSASGTGVTLSSGFTVACPAATGSRPCAGSAVIRLKGRRAPAASALTLNRSFSIPAGHTRSLKITITTSQLKALSKHGRRVTGTLQLTITGPNGQPSSVSALLHARLPMAH